MEGKKFVELVRKNNPDMDARLAEIYNTNMQNCFQRGFGRAWYLMCRWKEFSRRNRARFNEEYNIIKEKLAKNGLFGDFLEKETMRQYMVDKK